MTDFHEDSASAARLALELLDAFAARGIKAAVGGFPRATKDADLNVFVREDRHREALTIAQAPQVDRAGWTPADEARFCLLSGSPALLLAGASIGVAAIFRHRLRHGP